MVESPDAVRHTPLSPSKGRFGPSEDKPPFNDKAYYYSKDDDTDSTVRASNVQSSSSLIRSMDYTSYLQGLVRRVLGDFDTSDRPVIIVFLSPTFWDRRGEGRRESVQHMWRVYNQVIDDALLDELLRVRLRARDSFNEILNYVHADMTLESSTPESPHSSLASNAGYGSARVQGTPFGQPDAAADDHDGGATEDAVAVRPTYRNPGRNNVVPPGNAQDGITLPWLAVHESRTFRPPRLLPRERLLSKLLLLPWERLSSNLMLSRRLPSLPARTILPVLSSQKTTTATALLIVKMMIMMMEGAPGAYHHHQLGTLGGGVVILHRIIRSCWMDDDLVDANAGRWL